MEWREWPGKLSLWVKFRRPPATPRRKTEAELAAVKADRDGRAAEAERLTALLRRRDELLDEQRTEIRKLQADVDVLTHTVEGQAKMIVAQQALVEMVGDQATWMGTQPGDRAKGHGNAFGGGSSN